MLSNRTGTLWKHIYILFSPLNFASNLDDRLHLIPAQTVRGHNYASLQGTPLNLSLTMNSTVAHSQYMKWCLTRRGHYSLPTYIVFTPKMWIKFRLTGSRVNPMVDIIEVNITMNIIMNTLYLLKWNPCRSHPLTNTYQLHQL